MDTMKNMPENERKRLTARLERVNACIRERGIYFGKANGESESISNSELLTGYTYGEFYDWDLYFENIYMSYFGVSRFCRTNVEMFLDRQLECGFVARTLVQPRWRQHFKPFLAQICVLGSRQTGNWLWLKDKYYTRLEKYLDYWTWFSDFDKNGLSVWDSADHSGMDNQSLRCGVLYSMTTEGVDLNCYIYREFRAMAVISEKLGLGDKAEYYRAKAEELKDTINRVMWDEETGFYYDRNERTGELVKVKSASSFTPLWAGVATPERARRLVEEHLTNRQEFWAEYPITSWAMNETGYYQQRRGGECTWMGACWVCINYMVMHGLVNYGYDALARELAESTYKMVLSEEDTREYYNAETGCGQGLNPFWGWSTLGYFMPLELETGYDPTDPEAEEIRPLGITEFGIEF